MRTLEQRLKLDHGLTIGCHVVDITHEGRKRRAVVEIRKRGAVYLLFEPWPEDMYSSWSRITGDTYSNTGGVIVWAARDPAIRAMFSGEPVATIPLKDTSA